MHEISYIFDIKLYIAKYLRPRIVANLGSKSKANEILSWEEFSFLPSYRRFVRGPLSFGVTALPMVSSVFLLGLYCSSKATIEGNATFEAFSSWLQGSDAFLEKILLGLCAIALIAPIAGLIANTFTVKEITDLSSIPSRASRAKHDARSVK